MRLHTTMLWVLMGSLLVPMTQSTSAAVDDTMMTTPISSLTTISTIIETPLETFSLSISTKQESSTLDTTYQSSSKTSSIHDSFKGLIVPTRTLFTSSKESVSSSGTFVDGSMDLTEHSLKETANPFETSVKDSSNSSDTTVDGSMNTYDIFSYGSFSAFTTLLTGAVSETETSLKESIREIESSLKPTASGSEESLQESTVRTELMSLSSSEYFAQTPTHSAEIYDSTRAVVYSADSVLIQTAPFIDTLSVSITSIAVYSTVTGFSEGVYSSSSRSVSSVETDLTNTGVAETENSPLKNDIISSSVSPKSKSPTMDSENTVPQIYSTSASRNIDSDITPFSKHSTSLNMPPTFEAILRTSSVSPIENILPHSENILTTALSDQSSSTISTTVILSQTLSENGDASSKTVMYGKTMSIEESLLKTTDASMYVSLLTSADGNGMDQSVSSYMITKVLTERALSETKTDIAYTEFSGVQSATTVDTIMPTQTTYRSIAPTSTIGAPYTELETLYEISSTYSSKTHISDVHSANESKVHVSTSLIFPTSVTTNNLTITSTHVSTHEVAITSTTLHVSPLNSHNERSITRTFLTKLFTSSTIIVDAPSFAPMQTYQIQSFLSPSFIISTSFRSTESTELSSQISINTMLNLQTNTVLWSKDINVENSIPSFTSSIYTSYIASTFTQGTPSQSNQISSLSTEHDVTLQPPDTLSVTSHSLILHSRSNIESSVLPSSFPSTNFHISTQYSSMPAVSDKQSPLSFHSIFENTTPQISYSTVDTTITLISLVTHTGSIHFLTKSSTHDAMISISSSTVTLPEQSSTVYTSKYATLVDPSHSASMNVDTTSTILSTFYDSVTPSFTESISTNALEAVSTARTEFTNTINSVTSYFDSLLKTTAQYTSLYVSFWQPSTDHLSSTLIEYLSSSLHECNSFDLLSKSSLNSLSTNSNVLSSKQYLLTLTSYSTLLSDFSSLLSPSIFQSLSPSQSEFMSTITSSGSLSAARSTVTASRPFITTSSSSESLYRTEYMTLKNTLNTTSFSSSHVDSDIIFSSAISFVSNVYSSWTSLFPSYTYVISQSVSSSSNVLHTLENTFVFSRHDTSVVTFNTISLNENHTTRETTTSSLVVSPVPTQSLTEECLSTTINDSPHTTTITIIPTSSSLSLTNSTLTLSTRSLIISSSPYFFPSPSLESHVSIALSTSSTFLNETSHISNKFTSHFPTSSTVDSISTFILPFIGFTSSLAVSYKTSFDSKLSKTIEVYSSLVVYSSSLLLQYTDSVATPSSVFASTTPSFLTQPSVISTHSETCSTINLIQTTAFSVTNVTDSVTVSTMATTPPMLTSDVPLYSTSYSPYTSLPLTTETLTATGLLSVTSTLDSASTELAHSTLSTEKERTVLSPFLDSTSTSLVVSFTTLASAVIIVTTGDSTLTASTVASMFSSTFSNSGIRSTSLTTSSILSTASLSPSPTLKSISSQPTPEFSISNITLLSSYITTNSLTTSSPLTSDLTSSYTTLPISYVTTYIETSSSPLISVFSTSYVTSPTSYDTTYIETTSLPLTSDITISFTTLPTFYVTISTEEPSSPLISEFSTAYKTSISSYVTTYVEITTSTFTSSSIPPPTTPPVISTTANASTASEDTWVKTVLKVLLTADINDPAFKAEMERNLAIAYHEAFARKRLIAEGKFQPLQKRRRKRYTVVGDTAVHVHDLSRKDGGTEVTAVYTVENNGSIVQPASAVEALSLLDTQELAIMLRQVVASKAETYIPTVTPVTPSTDGIQIWIIGAIAGGVGGVLVIVCIAICIYCKCCAQKQREQDDGEPELMSIEPETAKKPDTKHSRSLPPSPSKKPMVHQSSTFSLKKGRSYEVDRTDKQSDQQAIEEETLVQTTSRSQRVVRESLTPSKSPRTFPGKLAPPVRKGGRSSKNAIDPAGEMVEMASSSFHSDASRNNRSNRNDHFQSSFSEDTENIKDHLKTEKEKNKRRNSEKYLDTNGSSTQSILGMPSTTVSSVNIGSGTGSKNESPSRPTFTQTPVDDAAEGENLQEARNRMHTLLDEAFALITPRGSFTDHDKQHAKAKYSENERDTDTLVAARPSYPLVDPGYINPAYASSYSKFLEIWSPYRAADQVALISMPNKTEAVVTKLGGSKNKANTRPVSNINFIDAKSTYLIEDNSKYTSNPGKPIRLRTKGERVSSGRPVKMTNNYVGEREFSVASLHDDARLPHITTSLSKTSKSSLVKELESDSKANTGEVRRHRKPDINLGNKDVVDVVNDIKPEEKTDNLFKSLRDELAASKMESEEDINKKPIRRKGRKPNIL